MSSAIITHSHPLPTWHPVYTKKQLGRYTHIYIGIIGADHGILISATPPQNKNAEAPDDPIALPPTYTTVFPPTRTEKALASLASRPPYWLLHECPLPWAIQPLSLF